MSRWGISRIGVLAVVGWTVAVALAGSVAWRAVTVIDTDTTAATVLSQAEVLDALAQVRATAGPATPVPTPTPSTTPTASPAPEVVRSWTITGGTVAASCRDADITLLYATPVDGWKVEVKDAGPDQVVVELEGADQEVTVQASCVAGVPEQRVVAGSDQATSSPASAGGGAVTPTRVEGSDDDGSQEESPEGDPEDGSERPDESDG